MGSLNDSQTKRRCGKVDSLLNEKLKNVKWGEFKIQELFEISRGNISNQKELISDKSGIVFVAQNNDYNGFVDTVKLVNHKQFKGNSLIVGRQTGVVYYQEKNFITTDGVLVLIPKNDFIKNREIGLAIASALNKKMFSFGYNNTVSAEKLNKINIQLPTKNGKIDFDFMENFIAELEAERLAELEAYLVATGLKDYTLTDKEKQVLEDFENVQWQTFNLERLFGKSTRGKRLKSDDRISGDLPFVTAGETDTGISAFIGNDVTVFSDYTTTIDMFGSAKYRNYKYGGDDHIAVVHTENLPKFASIFVTTAIHKASYTGKFDYGRNFYAKDADELNIVLPIKSHQPDYETMHTFISAIQKLVIKDVVTYADKKIAATKHVIA